MSEQKALTKIDTTRSLTREELCQSLGLTIDAIKKHYAPNATDAEFAIFIDQAAACNLDPRKGEVHFVKYGDQRASIITAYNTYIQRAERTGLLDGWKAELLKNKEGNVAGARVTIWRKDWENPFVWDVDRREFDKGKSTWKSMPGFMLKKVAIAQAFRLAFPEELAGLPYTSDEVSSYVDDNTGKAVIEAVEANAAQPSPSEMVVPEIQPPPPPVDVAAPKAPAQAPPVQPTQPLPAASPAPPPPPPPLAPAPVAPPPPPVTQETPQAILSEDHKQKVYVAFKGYGITAADLAIIAGDPSVWTEPHRLWLLSHFKKLKDGSLPVENFKAMKYQTTDDF